MCKLGWGFAVIAVCIASASLARADAVYSYGFDQANYNSSTGSYTYTLTPVSAGDGSVSYYTCSVNVYLYEYTTGAGETYIAPSPPNAAEGLASAGVALTQTGGTSNYTVTATGGAGFDGFNQYLSSDLASGQVTGVLSFQDGTTTTGVTGTAIDANTTALLIGTFTFTVPADTTIGPYSPLTFETSDLHDWMVDNLTFLTMTDIDALLNGSTPAVLTVVPEPPSVVALSGLAMMGAVMWVVRRARRFRAA
jgi:hypothetical protein